MRGITALSLVTVLSQQANAFTVLSPIRTSQINAFQPESQYLVQPSSTILYAGGFEWEDPAEAFDQGVENPYENPELNLLIDSSEEKSDGSESSTDGEEGGEPLKIDPARLLGPRLNGSNLYLVGMMGCGKSAVGDVVARSKLLLNFIDMR